MHLVNAEIPCHFIKSDANKYDYLKLGNFDTIIDIGAFHHFRKFNFYFFKIESHA